ncbi:TonB-dependent receptor plug domain-containing protein [Maribacter sp. 2307UL18-2]|uniref:TonB-dependent receptor plug domain-containing protein n=1 Tax=Maribacter sp. 2307UL18-2 TaxID=3386274 RepID=UPI0039BC5935
MEKNLTILLFFLASLLSAQEVVNRNTTICWDVSASMTTRNLEKDLSVLKKVFERNPDQEIQLLLFGTEVTEKKYGVTDGDWSQLREDLENVSYDGATIYGVLKGKIKNDNVYMFTDGQKSLSKDNISLKGKSFLINSSPNGDSEFLERSALLNKSRLMDFAAMLPENVMRLQQKAQSDQSSKESTIKGTVYVDNKPAADVRVAVKGLSDSFLTGPSGGFSIPAQVGDTLVVTSRTSKTIKTVPVEIMAHVDVFMASNIVALDEVIVVEKELEKAEMALTGYGLQKQEAIGYTVSEIDDEDISEVTTTIGDAINTKVTGLEVPGQNAWDREAGGLGAAKIRGSGSINMNTNALVVVNGVPMKRSTTSVGAAFQSNSNNAAGSFVTSNANMDYIDPANIANITVLKGLAATNAWGSEGRGGVILITTKTAVFTNQKTGKPIDRALLKNNVYKESQEEDGVQTSPTVRALMASDSPQDAYNTYLALKDLNGSNSTFYLDAFQYFRTKDTQLAQRVISNLLEHSRDNLETLRTVAKALSAIGDPQNVVRINEEIIQLAPSDVNAYFNRAKAKIELGHYQETLNELLALERGDKYFSVNASPITKTLKREIKNLIARHRSKLNLSNVESEFLNNIKYKVRLVFEWNIPGAEFELQFVNPQKRYFNWEHTNSALAARITDELKNNYRLEEYEFYGDMTGEWVINAKYLGEKKDVEKIPFVLKTTVYKNFGLPNQIQEEIVVHFSEPNEKKNVRKLVVN